MKPFFYYQGLEKLSDILRGDENIYLGIRPYGFHAGNKLTLTVYPYLLCELIEKKGKTPQFKMFLFINDYEQDKLDGPDPQLYPFNIYPLQTTFQHTPDPNGCCPSIVDHWQPIIEKEIKYINTHFPKVQVIAIRNSQMKTDPVFKDILMKTISEPHTIKDILKTNSAKLVLDTPVSFAKVICPNCRLAQTQTVDSTPDTINYTCDICKISAVARYEDNDYWFYHKILAVPRIDICKIDLCITGSDHYNEGDYLIRQELIKKFSPNTKLPLTLYTPVVTSNGKPMGKSKGNYKVAAFSFLYKQAKAVGNKDKLIMK